MNAAEESRNEGRVEGLTKGRLEGEAHGLLASSAARFLFVRGFKLSELGQARVDACTDGAQLDACILRAASANDEADVFGG